ncbi:MAG TPA: hypothetical protein VJ023_09580 [Pyrinomonadaceae bacterium]|nr:hypothetical protein [Pyrinomonadaceae bacterium]
MKNSVMKCFSIFGFCTVITTLSIVTNAHGQSGQSDHSRISSRSVVLMATGSVTPSAGSILFRNQDGVFFSFYTSGLTNGDAVTLWMAVFNNPEFCATSPCTPADFANPAVNGTLLNTGGRVIGPDGSATYGAFRAVGDTTGARPSTGTGNGLVKPLSAEIHLVTRSHGPANLMDPMVLAQQLGMFNGGCPPNTCMNIHASVHQR